MAVLVGSKKKKEVGGGEGIDDGGRGIYKCLFVIEFSFIKY